MTSNQCPSSPISMLPPISSKCCISGHSSLQKFRSSVWSLSSHLLGSSLIQCDYNVLRPTYNYLHSFCQIGVLERIAELVICSYNLQVTIRVGWNFLTTEFSQLIFRRNILTFYFSGRCIG